MSYFDVLDILEIAARGGDTHAQFELAISLEEGDYGGPDVQTATDWYLKAAEAGHTSAINNLCLIAVRKESSLELPAHLWESLRKMAESGDRDAQVVMGLGYWEGRAFKQDFGQSFLWYERAARSGSAPAQFNLGGHYFEGKGVEKDLDAALHWYSLAADQAHELALLQLASMNAKGNGVPENTQKSITLYSCALRRGSMRAAVHLGLLYARGTDGAPNPTLAFELLRKSLELRDNPENGPTPASYIESAYYWLGKLTEENPQLVGPSPQHWFNEGAARGFESCIKAHRRLKETPKKRSRITHSKS